MEPGDERLVDVVVPVVVDEHAVLGLAVVVTDLGAECLLAQPMTSGGVSGSPADDARRSEKPVIRGSLLRVR